MLSRGFAPFGQSDHVAVSLSVDFAVISKNDAPYHRKDFDFSREDCDAFRYRHRDVPWNDIFRYGAPKAASKFSE